MAQSLPGDIRANGIKSSSREGNPYHINSSLREEDPYSMNSSLRGEDPYPINSSSRGEAPHPINSSSRGEDPHPEDSVVSELPYVTRGLSSLKLFHSGSISPKCGQKHQILDPELLTRAFKKVFPELTANINPVDYVDHLLAREVINFQAMSSIREKNDTKRSQEAARELLVEVCTRDGGCQTLMDLFIHGDINQRQLYQKVFTEYIGLLPESNDTSPRPMTKGKSTLDRTSSVEQSKSFDPHGRYAEVTFEVAFHGDRSNVIEQMSYRARLMAALTPGNPCWNELDKHLKSKGCILSRKQPSHDPTIHIIIPGLQVLLDVASNAEFEWKDLSNILQKSAIAPQRDGELFSCQLRNVEVKSFLSERHMMETINQLTERVGTPFTHGEMTSPPMPSSGGDGCNSSPGTRIQQIRPYQRAADHHCVDSKDSFHQMGEIRGSQVAIPKQQVVGDALMSGINRQGLGYQDSLDEDKSLSAQDNSSHPEIPEDAHSSSYMITPLTSESVGQNEAIPLDQGIHGPIDRPDRHISAPILQSPSTADSNAEAILLKQRRQDSTDQPELHMPQSPSAADSTGTKPKVLSTPESDLMTVLRRVTANKLGVGKTSSSKSSKLMNDITREIVASLQKDQHLVLRPEFTGSSFEGVKIESADEYDVMILLDGKDLEKEEQYPGYVALRPRDPNSVTFKPFLSCDGYVDPNQIRSKLYSWIQLSINERFPVDSQYAVQIRMAGPAVTLTIKLNDKRPGSETTDDLTHLDPNFKIDVDLVATFDVLYQQFVAKPFKSANKTRASESMVTSTLWWRQSYSVAEKRRLKKIDDDAGCRRQCLRLLKFLRLRESTFKCLPSYCYKMLLLNECNQLQEKKYWEKDMLAQRFLGLLRSMASCLEEKNLPNCFDPRINLLENLNEKAIANIKDRTNRIILKGVVEIGKILDKDPIK